MYQLKWSRSAGRSFLWERFLGHLALDTDVTHVVANVLEVRSRDLGILEESVVVGELECR